MVNKGGDYRIGAFKSGYNQGNRFPSLIMALNLSPLLSYKLYFLRNLSLAYDYVVF
jgi:hypothetical protein